MGLLKYLAKRGAPGSMTRTIISGYRAFKSKYPDMTDNDIYHEIIKVRYIQEKDKDIYDEVAFRIGSYSSLYDLIHEILLYEFKDFAALPLKNRKIIIAAVEEILQKEGFDTK